MRVHPVFLGPTRSGRALRPGPGGWLESGGIPVPAPYTRHVESVLSWRSSYPLVCLPGPLSSRAWFRRPGPLRHSQRLRHLPSRPPLVPSPLSMGNFWALRRTFSRESRNFWAATSEARRRPSGYRADDRAGRRRTGTARSRGQGGQARSLESTEPGPSLVLAQGRRCTGGGRGRTSRRDPRRADRRARPAAPAPRRFRMTDRSGTAGRD